MRLVAPTPWFGSSRGQDGNGANLLLIKVFPYDAVTTVGAGHLDSLTGGGDDVDTKVVASLRDVLVQKLDVVNRSGDRRLRCDSASFNE